MCHSAMHWYNRKLILFSWYQFWQAIAKQNTISKQNYFLLNTRFYDHLVVKELQRASKHNVLLEYSNLDVFEAIEADWIFDCHGEDHVSFEWFYMSMFELVDNWTGTMDIESYIVFLDNLFMQLFKPDSFYSSKCEIS